MQRNVVNLSLVLGILFVITACVCPSQRNQSSGESNTPDQPTVAGKSTPDKTTGTTSGKDRKKDDGDFVAQHETVSSTRYVEIDKQIKQEKLLERAADGLNQALILPHDIYLKSKDCGDVNAFYNPDEQSVTVCYELMEQFFKDFKSNGYDDHKAYDMTRDTLSFSSNGKAEDNLNFDFRAIDGGSRLRVIRRIDAEQLSQPVVIQSVYDKLSDQVDWDIYENRMLADKNAQPLPRSNQRPVSTSGNGRGETAADLRRSLDDWIAATNRRDIERQMSFYMPQLSAFYLTRNTPRSAVRAEKNRAFATARSIDIRAEEPEIIFQDGGQTAVMRFRKAYRIAGTGRTKSGEVVQELRWQKTSAGWRIFSERDIRVIR